MSSCYSRRCVVVAARAVVHAAGGGDLADAAARRARRRAGAGQAVQGRARAQHQPHGQGDLAARRADRRAQEEAGQLRALALAGPCLPSLAFTRTRSSTLVLARPRLPSLPTLALARPCSPSLALARPCSPLLALARPRVSRSPFRPLCSLQVVSCRSSLYWRSPPRGRCHILVIALKGYSAALNYVKRTAVQ